MCPFCPPWVFGKQNGGGNNNNEQSTSTNSKSSTDTLAFTVLFDTSDIDDTYPTGFAAAADYSAYASLLPSYIISHGACTFCDDNYEGAAD